MNKINIKDLLEEEDYPHVNIIIDDFEQYKNIRRILEDLDYTTISSLEDEISFFDEGWNRVGINNVDMCFDILDDIWNHDKTYFNYAELEIEELAKPIKFESKLMDLHDVIEDFKEDIKGFGEEYNNISRAMLSEVENWLDEDMNHATINPFVEVGNVPRGVSAQFECSLNKDYKDVIGKLPLQLVDPIALSTLGKVLQYGIDKYGEENKCSYQNGEIDTYIGAMLRHLVMYQQGELIDPESNMEHLEHMFFNAYAIIYLNSKKESEKL